MGNSYADYRDEVGLKIKYYRLKKGYTQDQLAKRIGIEGNHLSKIERAKVGVSLEMLFDIANALGIDAYKLLMFD